MCVEDIRYIEQETGGDVADDKSDNMPLAHLAKESSESQRAKSQVGSSKAGWDWFDYFMKANIPMQESLRYSSSFQAENLGESDLQNLTHRRMKTLGLSEKHVQRLQRFIESETPEPPSDDEAAASVKKAKGKRNVSFGATSVIGEDSNGYDARQAQIEEDERLARDLQEQENGNQSSPSIFKKDSSSGLQRRGTSRPTPATSAPKGINADIFELMKGQLSTEPLKPTVTTPSPKQTTAKVEPAAPIAESNKTQTKPSGGFEDDAWAPRQTSPVVAKKPETASPAPPSWKTSWTTAQPQQPSPAPVMNTVTNIQPTPNVQAPVAPAPPLPPPLMPSIQQQQQQPVITSPARQRPIPKQTQENKVNAQVFNQWSSPAKTPVSQQPTGMVNPSNQPGNFQQTPTQVQANNTVQPQMNIAMQQQQLNNQQQRPFLAPQNTGFVPQQQQQFISPPNQPQLTGMQRPQSMMTNNMMAGPGLQPNQGLPQSQGLQPAMIPANTGVQNMLQPQQNMQQFQTLQPQPTGFNTFNSNIGRSNSAGNLPNMAINPQAAGINPQPTGQRSWANATPDNPFGASQQTPQMTGQTFNQTSPLQQQQNMFSPMQPQQTGFMQQPQQTGFGNNLLATNGQAMDRSFSGPTFGSNSAYHSSSRLLCF